MPILKRSMRKCYPWAVAHALTFENLLSVPYINAFITCHLESGLVTLYRIVDSCEMNTVTQTYRLRVGSHTTASKDATNHGRQTFGLQIRSSNQFFGQC